MRVSYDRDRHTLIVAATVFASLIVLAFRRLTRGIMTMENETQLDQMRRQLAQVEQEIEHAQMVASSTESLAAKAREAAESANQEALAAQKNADAAEAHLANKKIEYAKILQSVAGSLTRK
jgi:septal ring factor EnvC (AmiA/AmiB activator)